MKVFHLTIDSIPTLESFSPIEIVEEIVKRCKSKGELIVDVYTTEVK